MKKSFLLPLFCLLSSVVFGQTTITTIYATGGTGSFKTGFVTTTARTSGDIRSNSSGTVRRGFGVFDLSTIPAGAIIDSCVIGFNVSTYGGSGTPSGWDTYGYAGDLSTVATASTLYADCISGTSISTATYGTAVGNQTLPTTAAAQSFISAHAGSDVSICWTGGNTVQYTITGLAGTMSVTGTHAPYMVLKYCTGVSSVTATANPGSVCAGGTLSLAGAGSGTTSYSWAGPASFTSTLQNPTLTFSAAAAGVYTLTAYNAGGCATSVTTAAVALNTTPGVISGSTTVCPGESIALSETSPGGAWSVTPSSAATISSTGVVTGVAGGAAIVSYGCGSGATYNITVKSAPSPVQGTDSTCIGTTTSLTDLSSGGSWSITPTAVATINGGGVVTGITAGNAIVSYTDPTTTCSSFLTVRIDPPPSAITGTPNECLGQTTTLSDAVPGGIWSSTNASIASVNAAGVVTGIVVSNVTIKYTTVCGMTSISNTVKGLPGAIAGITSVCVQSTTTLSDDINGGTWSSSNTALATVPGTISGSAAVYGIAGGDALITYTLPTSCYVTTPLSIIALPEPITVPAPGTACIGDGIFLNDLVAGGTYTSNDTNVAVVTSSGVLTGVSTDSVTIFYTMPVGCFVSTRIFVNLSPAPITGSNPICAGLADTLSDDTTGGVWSSANTAMATVSNTGIVTSIAAGNVLIEYTNTVTGCYASVSELVRPLPVPVITFNGPLATFSTDTFYVNYQWLLGTSPTDLDSIPGAVSHNAAALYNEYYSVIVTDTFGCVNAAVPYHMEHLAVANVSGNDAVSVYPNPATSTLYISNATTDLRAVINDATGKILINQPQAKQVNISRFATGVYFISLFDNDDRCVKTERFVKD